MKIVLSAGETLYALINGQPLYLSASPFETGLCPDSPLTSEDHEEETCECGSPYSDCDGSDCPVDEDGCEDSDDTDCPGCDSCTDEESADEDSVEEDNLFDEESWSEGYDQGFLDGLDFSDQSDEECSDETSETDCPCCDYFEALDFDDYGTGHHSHAPDCQSSHEVN